MKKKFFIVLLLVSLFMINTFAFAASVNYTAVSIPSYNSGGGAVSVAIANRGTGNPSSASNNCTWNQNGTQCYSAVRNTNAIKGVDGSDILANTLITTGAYFTTGTKTMSYLANAKITTAYSTRLRVQASSSDPNPNIGTAISGTYNAGGN